MTTCSKSLPGIPEVWIQANMVFVGRGKHKSRRNVMYPARDIKFPQNLTSVFRTEIYPCKVRVVLERCSISCVLRCFAKTPDAATSSAARAPHINGMKVFVESKDSDYCYVST